jgi:hypothetical protein
MSSSNMSAGFPYVVNKSSLVESVFSPKDKFVAGSDGSLDVAADVTSSNGKAGSGECLPRVPEGGLSVTATSRGNDLQAEGGSRPVENQFGNQVGTKYDKTTQGDKGQFSGKSRKDNIVNKGKQVEKGIQILGYVPIQVVNLSLEEGELQKQTHIGEASPIGNGDVVQRDVEINCYD